jgi:ribose transport system permease protein
MSENRDMNTVAKKIKEIVSILLGIREFTLSIILLLFCILLAISSKSFLTMSNFRVIFIGLSYEMIVCSVMTIALIGGLIDFSVGSMVGLSGFVCSIMLKFGWNIWICIFCSLILGIIFGLINGVIICKLKILPMVATMGTWMLYKGLGLVMIRNQSIANLPAAFKTIGQQWNLFGIPFSIIIMASIVIAAWFALRYIPFFHQAYYIGESKESAKLAGINTNKFIIVIYALSGLSAALAGVMLASRFGSAPSTLGSGLEFRLITGMLIGGISFSGGEGSIFGAFMGALLMQIITNAMAMFNVESNMQSVVVGTILIFAVALDAYNQRRRTGT